MGKRCKNRRLGRAQGSDTMTERRSEQNRKVKPVECNFIDYYNEYKAPIYIGIQSRRAHVCLTN